MQRPSKFRSRSIALLLYTVKILDIIEGRGLIAHSYADDTQIYHALAAPSAVQRFTDWVECIKY